MTFIVTVCSNNPLFPIRALPARPEGHHYTIPYGLQAIISIEA